MCNPTKISMRAGRAFLFQCFHEGISSPFLFQCKYCLETKSFKNEENVFQENMEICDDLSVILSTSVEENATLTWKKKEKHRTSSKIYSYLK